MCGFLKKYEVDLKTRASCCSKQKVMSRLAQVLENKMFSKSESDCLEKAKDRDFSFMFSISEC